MTNRPRSFFFHFNKPLTMRRKKPTISVHYRGACHFVDNVVAKVPTLGRIRKTQPRFVMTGVAKSMTIVEGVSVLE
jgi:hypothetical protein